MMLFRNYSSNDYPQVKEILKEADLFYEDWHSKENINSMVELNPELIQVAVKDDKVIGAILIVLFGKKVAFFYSLAVKKEFRNQGIATKLINHAEEIMRIKGVKEFGLYVKSKNKELINFYKKRNFQTWENKYIYMWR